MKKEPKGKSIRWMVTMLMLLMAGIGWGIAAGSYSRDIEGWGPEMHDGDEIVVVNPVVEFFINGIRYFWNGLVQIRNIHRVVWHTMSVHPGILVVIAVLETGVWCFGWWVSQVEKQLEAEKPGIAREPTKKARLIVEGWRYENPFRGMCHVNFHCGTDFLSRPLLTSIIEPCHLSQRHAGSPSLSSRSPTS